MRSRVAGLWDENRTSVWVTDGVMVTRASDFTSGLQKMDKRGNRQGTFIWLTQASRFK